MLNFPFYNKHSNYLILDKNLRDYIKKSNTCSFNKFAEKQEHQQYKKTKPNSSNSLLYASLINYRNYSDTFTNNQNCDCDLENEDYLCNFCDLNNDDDEFNNKNSKHDAANTAKLTIAKKMFFLIGGTTAFIGIGTGIAVLYYKYF